MEQGLRKHQTQQTLSTVCTNYSIQIHLHRQSLLSVGVVTDQDKLLQPKQKLFY